MNVDVEIVSLPKLPKILQPKPVDVPVVQVAPAVTVTPPPQAPIAPPMLPQEAIEIARFDKPTIFKKKKVAPPPELATIPARNQDTDELDWRKILSMSLDPRSMERIASERSMAQFLVKIRQICPETTWICVAEQSKFYLSQVEIIRLQTWFERLVAEPVWPSPSQVIIVPDLKTEKKTLSVIFPKLDKKDIPYSVPASNLIVLPYRKGDVHGLTVHFQETFNLNRAGNA